MATAKKTIRRRTKKSGTAKGVRSKNGISKPSKRVKR